MSLAKHYYNTAFTLKAHHNRVIASYLAKVANYNLSNLHWALPLGVTFEFCRHLRRQKTRVPGLSCGVVCVILGLAVSVEHRRVTDT